ncbi:MAG: hypothetical protein GY931_14775, partial [Maribacter sp.]|nr:hypothetical protein [Maribacter sp.]
MNDPFQDVDAYGEEFLQIVTVALENRAAEEQIIPIIEAYLDDLDWIDGGAHLEIGAGTGAISRRMASRVQKGEV